MAYTCMVYECGCVGVCEKVCFTSRLVIACDRE